MSSSISFENSAESSKKNINFGTFLNWFLILLPNLPLINCLLSFIPLMNSLGFSNGKTLKKTLASEKSGVILTVVTLIMIPENWLIKSMLKTLLDKD